MTLESIKLRPAREEDEEFLRLVYAESRREELDQVVWPEGAREQFLRFQFDAQAAHYANYTDAEFLIVEVAGIAAGRLYLQRTASAIHVMEIALLPDYRGRGIGTALLRPILDEGQASARKVTMHVEKFNPALRLYERLGFRIADDKGVYWFLEL